MYLWTNKIIYSLSIAMLLFSGCGGGATTTSTETTVSPSSTSTTTTPTASPSIATTASTPSSKAVHSGQVKDSVTGKGLANVAVSIGSDISTTDQNGFYTFSHLSETEEAVINFKKEGYFFGSTKIQIKELSGNNTASTNYLEYNMRAHNYQWNFESTGEIIGGSIMIDASYVDNEGNPYSGTISAQLTILDLTTDEGKKLFSGSFKGIESNGNIVQFESYGLISIQLEDSNGDALKFANGERGTLIFDKISSSEKLSTIPLWYYDYDQGLWVEEGYAELQGDGTYKGEISHLGTWSLNKPLDEDPGIYSGRIIDKNGAPIGDVRVYAIGKNWVSSDLTTDENGVFELNVIPGESFELSAYDYQDKYAASYNGTIAAIASGDIVEN